MNSTDKAKTSVILQGASGKMGVQIVELLKSSPWQERLQLHATVGSKESPETFVVPAQPAVVVDFSRVPGILKWAPTWARLKIPTLVCTTGFQKEEFETLKTTLAPTAWAFIPNTSLGIYAFVKCLNGLVKFFSDVSRIEIHEVHHVHKKDAPSGTALLLKAAMLHAGYAGDIDIQSKREGEVIGLHTVILHRKYDRFILTHDALDRKLFAEGALLLGEKLATRPPRPEPYSYDELLV